MRMREQTHECERDNNNTIFYSVLWKGWSLRIEPEHGDYVFILIKYCPYCGEELK